MAADDLTELQRTSLKMLDEFILNPNTLMKNCPLDHGRHTLKPRFDLGNLQDLPTELHHQILGHVDILSLLTFRRVNQSAIDTVNGMTEYHKIMDKAANCIRMAIGIQTAHTFTIKQLFAKLCQKTCDGPQCGKLAPYMDVFTLARRCLSVGGGCKVSVGPVEGACCCDLGVEEGLLNSFRCFHAIAGTYGKYWFDVLLTPFKTGDDAYYEYAEVKRRFKNSENAGVYDRIDAEGDAYWKICAVSAPWLSQSSSYAEHGVFCSMCEANLQRWDETPRSLREAQLCSKENEWEYEYPNPMEVPFMTIPQLEEHMQSEHPQGDGDIA